MRHALQIVLFKLKSQPCDVFAERYDHLANQVSQMAVWASAGFSHRNNRYYFYLLFLWVFLYPQTTSQGRLFKKVYSMRLFKVKLVLQTDWHL
jgi:hypothetical protein